MKKIVINGKFLGERMQGIVRYAREMVASFDALCEGEDVVLLTPTGVEQLPLKNIRQVAYGKRGGIKWEQLDLAKYMRKHRDAICLNLCNVAPIFACAGVTVVHDIMYKVNPSHYTTFRNRISRLWHVYQYRLVTKREKVVLTDSIYSKQEIEKHYPKAKGKISVIPCAWQHVLSYREEPLWQEKYPFLQEKQYFFSLSTLAKNKNGKWILEVAKRNPNEIFAIGGKYYETEGEEIPQNVYMLGFISDEDACSLIKHCKAFIHPSLYEGFGLPPLEALALGADVICSNATSLPEVMGQSARYIDPYDYEISLPQLLEREVAPREKALEVFSWDKSAKMLYDVLNSV